MTFAIIDIIFALVVLFCIIHATIKGFIAEFFSKAALILGGLCAVLFYKKFSPTIAKLVGPNVFSEVVAFLLLFIGVYVAVKLIQQLIGSFFTGETLTGLDKALGFFLGIVEGVLIVAVILIILDVQPFFDVSGLTRDSFFYNILNPFLGVPKDAVQQAIDEVTKNIKGE